MKLLPTYLEEDGAKFSNAISLHLNMKVLSKDDAKSISDYMSSCMVIDTWLSNIKDVITNEMTIPSQTWSDGVYIWHSSHIHYAKEYRARLPVNFVDHAKKQIALGATEKRLNKESLYDEFEGILKNLAEGDESYYDGSFNP